MIWFRSQGLAFATTPKPTPEGYSNTKELGAVLYTQHVYAFEIASVILLLAIVAAITLTMRRAARPEGAGRREAGRGAARGPSQDRESGNEHGALMLTITTAHYLVLAAILFSLSVAGIFINRKNVILLLMCIELMLLAVNFNFIAFSRMLDDTLGQVFVFFILTVAAAEAAIGLAILVVLFRSTRSIDVDELDRLKG